MSPSSVFSERARMTDAATAAGEYALVQYQPFQHVKGKGSAKGFARRSFQHDPDRSSDSDGETGSGSCSGGSRNVRNRRRGFTSGSSGGGGSPALDTHAIQLALATLGAIPAHLTGAAEGRCSAAAFALSVAMVSAAEGGLPPPLLRVVSPYSRLDHRLMALKTVAFRSDLPPWAPPEQLERQHAKLLREVQALASLDGSAHVVRYYNAWIEPAWEKLGHQLQRNGGLGRASGTAQSSMQSLLQALAASKAKADPAAAPGRRVSKATSSAGGIGAAAAAAAPSHLAHMPNRVLPRLARMDSGGSGTSGSCRIRELSSSRPGSSSNSGTSSSGEESSGASGSTGSSDDDNSRGGVTWTAALGQRAHRSPHRLARATTPPPLPQQQQQPVLEPFVDLPISPDATTAPAAAAEAIAEASAPALLQPFITLPPSSSEHTRRRSLDTTSGHVSGASAGGSAVAVAAAATAAPPPPLVFLASTSENEGLLSRGWQVPLPPCRRLRPRSRASQPLITSLSTSPEGPIGLTLSRGSTTRGSVLSSSVESIHVPPGGRIAASPTGSHPTGSPTADAGGSPGKAASGTSSSKSSARGGGGGVRHAEPNADGNGDARVFRRGRVRAPGPVPDVSQYSWTFDRGCELTKSSRRRRSRSGSGGSSRRSSAETSDASSSSSSSHSSSAASATATATNGTARGCAAAARAVTASADEEDEEEEEYSWTFDRGDGDVEAGVDASAATVGGGGCGGRGGCSSERRSRKGRRGKGANGGGGRYRGSAGGGCEGVFQLEGATSTSERRARATRSGSSSTGSSGSDSDSYSSTGGSESGSGSSSGSESEHESGSDNDSGTRSSGSGSKSGSGGRRRGSRHRKHSGSRSGAGAVLPPSQAPLPAPRHQRRRPPAQPVVCDATRDSTTETLRRRDQRQSQPRRRNRYPQRPNGLQQEDGARRPVAAALDLAVLSGIRRWPYTLYISMELVMGPTLTRWLLLRAERLGGGGGGRAPEHPPDPAILERSIFRQIVTGLCHVHAAGIIHRDLKPANIFLVPVLTGPGAAGGVGGGGGGSSWGGVGVAATEGGPRAAAAASAAAAGSASAAECYLVKIGDFGLAVGHEDPSVRLSEAASSSSFATASTTSSSSHNGPFAAATAVAAAAAGRRARLPRPASLPLLPGGPAADCSDAEVFSDDGAAAAAPPPPPPQRSSAAAVAAVKAGMGLPQSNSSSTSAHTSGVGTASYSAPEQLREQAGGVALYGPEVDVYPLGLILMELFCVHETAMERAHAMREARQGRLPASLHRTYPGEAKLAEACLRIRPEQRPTAAQILALLDILWGPEAGPGPTAATSAAAAATAGGIASPMGAGNRVAASDGGLGRGRALGAGAGGMRGGSGAQGAAAAAQAFGGAVRQEGGGVKQGRGQGQGQAGAGLAVARLRTINDSTATAEAAAVVAGALQRASSGGGFPLRHRPLVPPPRPLMPLPPPPHSLPPSEPASSAGRTLYDDDMTVVIGAGLYRTAVAAVLEDVATQTDLTWVAAEQRLPLRLPQAGARAGSAEAAAAMAEARPSVPAAAAAAGVAAGPDAQRTGGAVAVGGGGGGGRAALLARLQQLEAEVLRLRVQLAVEGEEGAP
ncbi:hypothetical protein PLESTM_001369400 [Pleodorina starrii]|nr:hypothetical protein PLESTM_001369400 [Pleodorina starrii]